MIESAAIESADRFNLCNHSAGGSLFIAQLLEKLKVEYSKSRGSTRADRPDNSSNQEKTKWKSIEVSVAVEQNEREPALSR